MQKPYSDIEIILVEDNIDDANLVIRSLQKCNLGNNLVHLGDGAEALEFIFATGMYEGRNVEDKPKLILLDLKMPKVDGLEVLRAIRADARTATIPVVVMTASEEDKDLEKSYALGANSYVVKPVGFENFAKVVAELGFYWLLVNQAPQ